MELFLVTRRSATRCNTPRERKGTDRRTWPPPSTYLGPLSVYFSGLARVVWAKERGDREPMCAVKHDAIANAVAVAPRCLERCSGSELLETTEKRRGAHESGRGASEALTVIAGKVGLLAVEASAICLFLLRAVASARGVAVVHGVCGALALGWRLFLGIAGRAGGDGSVVLGV